MDQKQMIDNFGFLVINETIEISHGDRIVIYTDGLTEVFNPRGELYGKERLLSGLSENRHLPVEKISDRIMGDYNRIT